MNEGVRNRRGFGALITLCNVFFLISVFFSPCIYTFTKLTDDYLFLFFFLYFLPSCSLIFWFKPIHHPFRIPTETFLYIRSESFCKPPQRRIRFMEQLNRSTFRISASVDHDNGEHGFEQSSETAFSRISGNSDSKSHYFHHLLWQKTCASADSSLPITNASTINPPCTLKIRLFCSPTRT